MTTKYDYPLWATQGGGLARRVGEHYVFVEAPKCSGLNIGDSVPDEWDLLPANAFAHDVIYDEEALAELEDWKNDMDAALNGYGLKGM